MHIKPIDTEAVLMSLHMMHAICLGAATKRDACVIVRCCVQATTRTRGWHLAAAC